jgi:rubredoxin
MKYTYEMMMPDLPDRFQCPVCIDIGKKTKVGEHYRDSNVRYQPGARQGRPYRKKYYRCSGCGTIFALRQFFDEYTGCKQEELAKDDRDSTSRVSSA